MRSRALQVSVASVLLGILSLLNLVRRPVVARL